MLPVIRKKNSNKPIIKFIGGIATFPPFVPTGVAIWDGDVTLTNAQWDDIITPLRIDFFNLPTINVAALNGHDTVTFDGINQYGISATPLTPQPYTIYCVFRQITWVDGGTIFSSGTAITGLLEQFIATPQLIQYAAGVGWNVMVPNLALNVWGIVTEVFNGANSQIRNMLNVPVIGNPGNIAGNGITLAARWNNTSYGNCEIAYIIIRNGADSTAVQNNFINWLKARFAL